MKGWIAALALGFPLFAGGQNAAPEAESASLSAGPTQAKSWRGVGTVEYVVRHPLHTVRGKSRKVEIRAVADGSGLKVMGRAEVRSFDSGNSNRDAHMLEAVRADRHPLVVLRGLARGFRVPAVPATFSLPLDSEVQLAGVAAPVAISAQVEQLPDGSWKVQFAFDHRLSAHSIERPKLLLVLIDDEITVRGEALLKAIDAKVDAQK